MTLLSLQLSELTEANMEYHNQQHEAINLEEKIFKSSPYYRGLTDSSLAINRPSSPGRESFVTVGSAATFQSFSSFVSKVKDFNPCFGCSKGRDSNHEELPTKEFIAEKQGNPTNLLSASSSTKHSSPSDKKAAPKPPRMEIIGGMKVESDRRERRNRAKSSASSPRVLIPKEIPTALEKGIENAEEISQTDFNWAKDHQPKILDEFICNQDKVDQLKKMTKEGGCGHFIFEGPPGVGKKTMIWAMLRELYGKEELEIREKRKVIKLKSELVGSIQVPVKESRHHVEVNLSELRGYEKQVIVELIKEPHSKKYKKEFPLGPGSCRGIILCAADKLSTDALLYIKWVIENYEGCNKIFFCCSDVSKLEPVRSLCTLIQLLPASKEETVKVLDYIAKKEGIILPLQLAYKIVDYSNNNLRQAIRSFEATFRKSYPFEEDQEILSGWEDDIANIAKMIIEEQSPRQLYVIRRKLQKLIAHNISADHIFKSLVEELKKNSNSEFRSRIEVLYSDYNKNDEITLASIKATVMAQDPSEENNKRFCDPMRNNAQQYLKIEEFIAKFMSYYKMGINKKNNPVL